jgi:hypothetical protein
MGQAEVGKMPEVRAEGLMYAWFQGVGASREERQWVSSVPYQLVFADGRCNTYVIRSSV